jgi:hypothetical protein
MATIFPLDPEVNDTYTSGSVTWIWDGEAWVRSFVDDTVNTDVLVDIVSQTVSITANTATTISSFATTKYRTAEFIVQITQGTDYYSSKIFLIHDGTNTKITQYGILESTVNAIPVTISSTISGGNVLLRATVTDASTSNCAVKIIRTAVTV